MTIQEKIFLVRVNYPDALEDLAIFKTEEEANAFVTKYIKINPHDKDDCEIVPWNFGEPEEYSSNLFHEIQIGEDGYIRSAVINANSHIEKRDYFFSMRKPGRFYGDLPVTTYMTCYFETEDKEEAIRLADEKRLQLIKDGKWPKDLEKPGERYYIE